MSRIELDSSKKVAKEIGISHLYQARISPAKCGWLVFGPQESKCVIGFNFIGLPAHSKLLNAAIFPRYGISNRPTPVDGVVKGSISQVKDLVERTRTMCATGSFKGGGFPVQAPPVLPA